MWFGGRRIGIKLRLEGVNPLYEARLGPRLILGLSCHGGSEARCEPTVIRGDDDARYVSMTDMRTTTGT